MKSHAAFDLEAYDAPAGHTEPDVPLRAPMTTNPAWSALAIPISGHLHHTGTAHIVDLLLRQYNTLATDLDAFVVANVYPFTKDRQLQPGVTVRRRLGGEPDAERRPIKFEWENWFAGRSTTKVMPASWRRKKGESGQTIVATDESKGLRKRLAAKPAALERALQIEATIAPTRRALASLLKVVKCLEAINHRACVPVGAGHVVIVDDAEARLPFVNEGWNANYLPLTASIREVTPIVLKDYLSRRHNEITADMDWHFLNTIKPWQDAQRPAPSIAMRRRTAWTFVYYNWCHRRAGKWHKNVLSESQRNRLSEERHMDESGALSKQALPPDLLAKMLEFEATMAPYRAAQSRLQQALAALDDIDVSAIVPPAPGHQMTIKAGAHVALSIRMGERR